MGRETQVTTNSKVSMVGWSFKALREDRVLGGEYYVTHGGQPTAETFQRACPPFRVLWTMHPSTGGILSPSPASLRYDLSELVITMSSQLVLILNALRGFKS